MSWARTFVSTGIDVRSGRPRAPKMTARPVTNMASVDSMNGAPRIAPIPTLSDAALPPPNRIAMIGIIVSGSAVPTAASTDPTAPSASSSFRPNHSIPFVNSSAPTRMIANAPTRIRMSTDSGLELANGDADRDHGQDGHRDRCHLALAATGIAEQRGDDPSGRRGDDDQESEPDEASRAAGREVPDDAPDVEPWTARQRPDSGAE